MLDFGPVTLVNAGVTPRSAASANQPLNVTLTWQTPASYLGDLHVTLRLQDNGGQTWASRDYEPLGRFDRRASISKPLGDQLVDQVGLLIPVGMPPGSYTLRMGVGKRGQNSLFPVRSPDKEAVDLASIAKIDIVQPPHTLPVARLPLQTPLARPLVMDGITLLGSAGITPSTEALAGTQLPITLFFQNQSNDPPLRQLYLSVLDEHENGIGGWDGWPLSDYATPLWPDGALVRLTVLLYLPPTTTTGNYQLIAGFQDPESQQKSVPAFLTRFKIRRRNATFIRPTPSHPSATPLQFGTHAVLIGYDLEREDNRFNIKLYWQVLQTLLPPHHIFVHLDDAAGVTVAQADGPPVTHDGPAPTGSWLPDEFLITQHHLEIPAELAQSPNGHLTIRVGSIARTTRYGFRPPLLAVQQPITLKFLSRPNIGYATFHITDRISIRIKRVTCGCYFEGPWVHGQTLGSSRKTAAAVCQRKHLNHKKE